jgi:hypothetical protein
MISTVAPTTFGGLSGGASLYITPNELACRSRAYASLSASRRTPATVNRILSSFSVFISDFFPSYFGAFLLFSGARAVAYSNSRCKVSRK